MRRCCHAGALALAAFAASATPAGAAEPDAALLGELRRLAARLEKLEQHNARLEQRLEQAQLAEQRLKALEAGQADIERALQTDRLSEKEPEIVTRLKAAEYRVEDMIKQSKIVDSLDGFSAGASFTTVAQRANALETGMLLNYRADISVTTPTLKVGNVESRLFGHFRIGQGKGVAEKLTSFVGPNATSFQLGSIIPPESSAVMLAQAWYQADIPLPTDSPKSLSREKLTVNFGKMDPFGFFDQNAAANDETRQFLASQFVHNALLDNPLAANVGADGFGFAPGVRVSYLNERARPSNYRFSLGLFGAGKSADFSEKFKAPFVIAQAETRQRFLGMDGNYRIYVWRNGQAPTFVPDETRRHSGLGLSIDQRVDDYLTLFGRFGVARGEHLPFDRTLSLGAEMGGGYWGRAADALGLALGANRASADFRTLSASVTDAGGTPVYAFAARGAEHHAEIYYRYHIHKGFEFTPDFQWIRNPAANPDAKAVRILGARLQLNY